MPPATVVYELHVEIPEEMLADYSPDAAGRELLFDAPAFDGISESVIADLEYAGMYGHAPSGTFGAARNRVFR